VYLHCHRERTSGSLSQSCDPERLDGMYTLILILVAARPNAARERDGGPALLHIWIVLGGA